MFSLHVSGGMEECYWDCEFVFDLDLIYGGLILEVRLKNKSFVSKLTNNGCSQYLLVRIKLLKLLLIQTTEVRNGKGGEIVR